MVFFESDLAFRQHADEPIYDCRENCEMAIYRSTDIDEVNVWLKKLSENGFLAIRKNEIDGNRFAMFEKDGLHITSYYTPCDSSLRVTVGENPVPKDGEPVCDGDCETVFYGFENDHTYIDCGMCLLIQCPDYSFFVVDSGHYFSSTTMTESINLCVTERRRTEKLLSTAGLSLTLIPIISLK